jgi:hypothetical protein
LPGAVGLFADLDSAISLAFLARFDCQDRVDWLSAKRLAAWLASVGYSGRVDPAELYARLVAAPRGATGQYGAAQTHTTKALLAVLTTLSEQIKALTVQISRQLALHADQQIFTSLPRSGRVRAARLLAEIGDCRGRFPSPDSLACLAGVAPSTRQSGKSRAVNFRWACDKNLRDAVCDFAGDSRHTNPWAADLYQRARDRGHDHPHAVRISRPRMAVCDLALLAEFQRLRSQPTPSAPTLPQPRSSSRSLTQGISLADEKHVCSLARPGQRRASLAQRGGAIRI